MAVVENVFIRGGGGSESGKGEPGEGVNSRGGRTKLGEGVQIHMCCVEAPTRWIQSQGNGTRSCPSVSFERAKDVDKKQNEHIKGSQTLR